MIASSNIGKSLRMYRTYSLLEAMSSAVGLLFEAQTAQHFIFLSSIFQLGRSAQAIGVVCFLFTSKVIMSLFPTVRKKGIQPTTFTVRQASKNTKENHQGKVKDSAYRLTAPLPLTRNRFWTFLRTSVLRPRTCCG